MVHTIAMFVCCASSFKNTIIAAAAAASNPEVGSSKNKTLGSVNKLTAKDKRLFCPPDKPFKNWFPTFVSAQSIKPTVVKIASILSLFFSTVSFTHKSAA